MDKPFLFVDFAHPTWLLYVSLLVIAVFFRFSRLWSVRNLDIVLLLLIATTLVVASESPRPVPEDPSGAEAAVTESTMTPSTPDGTDTVPGAAASRLTVEQQATLSATDAPPAAALAADAAPATDTAQKADDAAAPISALQWWSSCVLLALSVLLICRLTFDESLTRRPRLEQNLNQAGLTFLCIPSFIILMSSVFVLEPSGSNVAAVKSGKALLAVRESGIQQPDAAQNTTEASAPGATETLFAAGATTVAELSGQIPRETPVELLIARILVVVAHTIVVLGLLYIGRRHFSSMQLGISMSCLYLLLPCTAFNVHELSHVLPAACLTWAFASYRKPAVAGVLLGLACGTLFFAVFLLPLWAVFYGKRGRLKFGLSLAAVTAVVLTTFALTSSDTHSFTNKLVTSTNWTAFRLFDDTLPTSGGAIGQVFLRITLAAVFFVMITAMTVIPRKRNLENLLANSTALIVAAQLWYPEDVGSYVLWYLPLLLLVMFRPRLDRFVPPDRYETRKAEQPTEKLASKTTGGAMPRVTLYH